MTTEKFKEAYKRLNKAQKEAVDTVEGPVMVAAGPGTGKTQILALRIANILLKTQVGPENILALTFTDSGVVSMRRRLAEMIGTPAYRVKISTFHGFCNEVIKDYPEYFPAIIGATSIDEVEQLRVLEEVIDRLDLEHLKTFSDAYFYLKDINAAISKLKREGVTPSTLAEFMDHQFVSFEKIDDLYNEKGKYAGQMKGKYVDLLKQIKKGQELAQVYKTYQEYLRKNKLYDYDDMILEVKSALAEKGELLLILQEQYQYILVDEHQDTNNAQNQVLELLASFYDEPNLFVVGDEKQAIYKFQGASLENFRYFRSKYPNAKLVVLEDNYRSSQLILDLAHSVLAGDKKLSAKSGHIDERIKICELSNETVEDYFVAKDVAQKIKVGARPEEIAVLYRNNSDLAGLPAMFDRLGVPYIIEANQDILADNDLRKLVLLFETINDFGNEEKFLEALHIDFLNIPSLDIYRLIKAASDKRTSPFSLLRQPESLMEAGIENIQKLEETVATLAELSKRSRNLPLAKFFEVALRESGYLPYILKSGDTVLAVRKLNGFYDEVKKLAERNKKARLADLIEYLKRLETHELAIKKRPDTVTTGRVKLMTAHRSKGLEFDHVYLIRVADGRWGNKRRNEKIKLPPELFAMAEVLDEEEDKNGEERRLFYVALTRARKTLTLTLARERADGREQVPSQFTGELDQSLVEKFDTMAVEQNFAAEPEIVFMEATPAAIAPRDFVQQLFVDQGMAVTHLNNYLTCPWRYFYSNLLRLPQAPTKSQIYGIAVHAALKDFFDKRNSGEQTDKKYLLMRFEDHMTKSPLPEKDTQELLTAGRKFLDGYHDAWEKEWPARTINEYKIKGVVLDDGIRIKGDIDKLEFMNDSNTVNVVDYKTSAPKTRGEIEGTTKDADGNIKRQLTFYKLLLDRYEDGRYKMASAEVDFLRPDSKGRYKKEKFMIEEGEVAELVDLIKKVANEIINLEFWDKRCDDKKCEYCALRDVMR